MTIRDIGEPRTDRNLKTANSRMKLHLSFSPLAALSHSFAHPIVLFAIIIILTFFHDEKTLTVIEINYSLNFIHNLCSILYVFCYDYIACIDYFYNVAKLEQFLLFEKKKII